MATVKSIRTLKKREEAKEVAKLQKGLGVLREYVGVMQMTPALKSRLIKVAKETAKEYLYYHLRGVVTLTKEQNQKILRGIDQINRYVFGQYNVSIKKIIYIVYGIALVLAFLYFSWQYDKACSLSENQYISTVQALYRGGQRLAGQLPSCEKNQMYYRRMMNAVQGLGASSFAAQTVAWIQRNGTQYIMGKRGDKNRYLEDTKSITRLEEVD